MKKEEWVVSNLPWNQHKITNFTNNQNSKCGSVNVRYIKIIASYIICNER